MPAMTTLYTCLQHVIVGALVYDLPALVTMMFAMDPPRFVNVAEKPVPEEPPYFALKVPPEMHPEPMAC